MLDLCRRFRVVSVGFDPWQSTQMAQRLRAEGVTVLEFRATTQNFSPAILELDAAMRSGRLRHDGNPVLEWCMGNVVGKPTRGQPLPDEAAAGAEDRRRGRADDGDRPRDGRRGSRARIPDALRRLSGPCGVWCGTMAASPGRGMCRARPGALPARADGRGALGGRSPGPLADRAGVPDGAKRRRPSPPRSG